MTNEPTERDVEAAVEAMVDTQDQFRESTTFHDLARAALAAVEPEPTERDAEALAREYAEGQICYRVTNPAAFRNDLTKAFMAGVSEGAAEAAERKVAAVEALAKAWVGFDDSHHYGDAVLNALREPTP